MPNLIELANELEKVMKAKETYQQEIEPNKQEAKETYLLEIESYKQKARACGVTEETLNYILHDPQVTVREAYE